MRRRFSRVRNAIGWCRYVVVGFHGSGEYSGKSQRPVKSQPLSLFNELKRRNVLRVGAAYIVAAWLIIQVVETIFPAFGFGDAAVRIVVIVLAIGFIPALILAWVFEITADRRGAQ